MEMILAIDLNGGLGYDNKLLAKLKGDLDFFKSKTLGKNIVMGDATWNSLPFKLKNRFSIVLTDDVNKIKSKNGNYPDLVIFNIDDIPSNSIIIGGASLYNTLVDKADRIYLTIIEHAFEKVDRRFNLGKLLIGNFSFTKLHYRCYDEEYPYTIYEVNRFE